MTLPPSDRTLPLPNRCRPYQASDRLNKRFVIFCTLNDSGHPFQVVELVGESVMGPYPTSAIMESVGSSGPEGLTIRVPPCTPVGFSSIPNFAQKLSIRIIDFQQNSPPFIGENNICGQIKRARVNSSTSESMVTSYSPRWHRTSSA